MKTRQLGRSALRLPPMMIGGNVFGWTTDEAMSFRLLDQALEAGLNAIDTADMYSTWVPGHEGGESEVVIGRWLKARGVRSKVIIATKVGKPMGGDRQGLSARWIGQGVEDSLRRLQTDHIDLYQAHADDESVPLEETMAAFGELVKSGKVRALGASNFGAARLQKALRVSAENGLPRYESLQPHYNLVEREDFEHNLAPLCEKEELGVIPYFALAAGFLTGKYRSKADLAQGSRGGMAARYMTDRGMATLEALDRLAKDKRVPVSEIALAWLAAQPTVTAPIVSATSSTQMDSLIRAANLTLTPGELTELGDCLKNSQVKNGG